MDADKVPYTEVILDDEVLRYKVIDGVPYFHYCDIMGRFLKNRTSMVRRIRQLKLEEGSDYYFVTGHPFLCPARKYKEYIVALPAVFKIINIMTTCLFVRVPILKNFVKETFGYTPEEPEVGYCVICGKVIPQSARTKYCSKECAALAGKRRSNRYWQENKAARTVTSTCPYCGKSFTQSSGRQIYCSKSCCQMAYRQRKKGITGDNTSRPKSAFYNPREVYPNVKVPEWGQTLNF